MRSSGQFTPSPAAKVLRINPAMPSHAISISAEPHDVTVSSLAELLKQTGTNTLQITEALGINYRTAQRRIQLPETMTLTELWGLSALLRVSEEQLLKLIRDEVRSRPSAAEPAPEELAALAEKKAPAKKLAAKKPGNA